MPYLVGKAEENALESVLGLKNSNGNNSHFILFLVRYNCSRSLQMGRGCGKGLVLRMDTLEIPTHLVNHLITNHHWDLISSFSWFSLMFLLRRSKKQKSMVDQKVIFVV